MKFNKNQNLYDYTFFELINYLKTLEKEERLIILNDRKIVLKLFFQNLEYAYESILEIYEPKDLILTLKEDLLTEIIKVNSQNKYIFQYLLKNNKEEFSKYIFENKKLLNLFITNSLDVLDDYIFEYDFTLKIINYMEINKLNYQEKVINLIQKFKDVFLYYNKLPKEFKKELQDIIYLVIEDIVDKIKNGFSINQIKNILKNNIKEIVVSNIKNESILTSQIFIDYLINNFSKRLENYLDKTEKEIPLNEYYNEELVYNLLKSSLWVDKLQTKFLNENISNQTLLITFQTFSPQVLKNYLNKNTISFNSSDIYSLMYRGVIPSNIYENINIFKENILSIDFNYMREVLSELEILNNVDYFYNLRDKMFNDIIKQYNKDTKSLSYFDNFPSNYWSNTTTNIFLDNFKNYYKDKNNILLTKKILLNIVINKIFDDSIRNVCINIHELIHFNSLLDKSYLSLEKINFYMNIEKLFEKTSDEILEFYNLYKNNNIKEMFYDDLRYMKNLSYQELKDKCIKIDDIKNLKNQELSNIYGVDIYEYNGEEFTFLVSCLSGIQNDISTFQRNCYTIISDKNTKVFKENSVIYGYLNFDINHIMHVFEHDAGSFDNTLKSSIFINRIRLPDEILSSNDMNEIQIVNDFCNIKNKYQRIKPSYIICFNNIDKESNKVAKELNIPIILINSYMYKNNNQKNLIDDLYDERYTISLENEDTYKTYKL